MIRFSLVIKNNKNEYLICGYPNTNPDAEEYEFLGGDIDTETLPSFEDLKLQIADVIREKAGISIDEIQKYELYTLPGSTLWIHTIFTARIKSGNPQKIFYTKLVWVPIDKIEVKMLNIYGLQVYIKISECGYCKYIRDRKDQIEDFFYRYFTKVEENLAILETLELIDDKSPIWMIAFKQELTHLRAHLIEGSDQKKNITVQNYLRLYDRADLAVKIDLLLQTEIKENLSLRDAIKEVVDKHIAHYDKTSVDSDNIYRYCIQLFSDAGKIPLKEFIRLLDGYIMSLIIEMWYDAGELGITMSNRSPEQRSVIINHGENLMARLSEALHCER